ncbi:hypothetical protein EV282_0319 [Fictibacillus sp. BK138]|nr:hypothetical protein EV282_0319 [Fictibacillus sp. BK138]
MKKKIKRIKARTKNNNEPLPMIWQGFFHIIARYFIKSHVSGLKTHIKLKNRTLIEKYTIFDTGVHSGNLAPQKIKHQVLSGR